MLLAIELLQKQLRVQHLAENVKEGKGLLTSLPWIFRTVQGSEPATFCFPPVWSLGHYWPFISFLAQFLLISSHCSPLPFQPFPFLNPIQTLLPSTCFVLNKAVTFESLIHTRSVWQHGCCRVPWMKAFTKKVFIVLWNCLPDSPMSRGGDEVQAAVDSAVRHLSSIHPRLWVQVVFKLAVYVVNDWLPAAW